MTTRAAMSEPEGSPEGETSGESNGGEGGNRTHPSTQSAEATILKTVTTTRHVSLSAFDPIVRRGDIRTWIRVSLASANPAAACTE